MILLRLPLTGICLVDLMHVEELIVDLMLVEELIVDLMHVDILILFILLLALN